MENCDPLNTTPTQNYVTSINKTQQMDFRKPLVASSLPNIVRGGWSSSNATTSLAQLKAQREENENSPKSAIRAISASAETLGSSTSVPPRESHKWLQMFNNDLFLVFVAPSSDVIVFVDILNSKCHTSDLDAAMKAKRTVCSRSEFETYMETKLEGLYHQTVDSNIQAVDSNSQAVDSSIQAVDSNSQAAESPASKTHSRPVLASASTPTVAPRRAPPRPPVQQLAAVSVEPSRSGVVVTKEPVEIQSNDATSDTVPNGESPNRAIYLRLRAMEEQQQSNKKINELTEELAKNEILLQEKQNSLAKLSGESKGLLDAIRNLKASKEKLKDQLDAQVAETKSQKLQHEKAQNALNQELFQARSEIELLKMKLDEAMSQLSSSETKYRALEDETLKAAHAFRDLKTYHKEYKLKAERGIQEAQCGGEEYQAMLENEKNRSQQFCKMEQEARGQLEKKSLEALRAKRAMEAVQVDLMKEQDANTVLRRELESRGAATHDVQKLLNEKELQLRELKVELFDAREELIKRKGCQQCGSL